MAQEQQEWKALGNIVPMMSLNKHINGVPNYSLHDTINMRMSNDRMALQNIEEVGDNEIIMNYLKSIYPDVYINPLVGYIKGYKILYILPCNNELILFVWNKSLSKVINPNGSKCVELIRYDERTKVINRVYSALTYYGGKYVGEYIYNNEDLIISFAESNSKNGYSIINLKRTIENIDIEENKLFNNPLISLPKLLNVSKVNGKFYSGYIDIYISYYTDDINKTKYFLLLNNFILLELEKKVLLRYKLNDSETIEDHNAMLNNNNDIINNTLKLIFDNLDTNYTYFSLGIIVHNRTSLKKYVTKKINTTVNEYTLDINNVYEEEFENFNYYISNINNMIAYKNRLYIASYKENNYTDILKEYNRNLANNVNLIPVSSIPNISFDRWFQNYVNFKKSFFADKYYILRSILGNNFDINAVKRYILIQGYNAEGYINNKSVINLSGTSILYDIIDNKGWLNGRSVGNEISLFLQNGLKIYLLGVIYHDGIIESYDFTNYIDDVSEGLNQVPETIIASYNRRAGLRRALQLNSELVDDGNNKLAIYAFQLIIGYNSNGSVLTDNIYGVSTHLGLSNNYGKGIRILTSDDKVNWNDLNVSNFTAFSSNSYYEDMQINKNIFDVEDYYPIFITRENNSKNISLRPLQIYNFYIHLVDNFGNITTGIRLKNNTLLKNGDNNADNDNYTLVYLPGILNYSAMGEGNDYSIYKGFYVIKENIKLDENAIFYRVNNVYKVNNNLWKFNLDGTQINNTLMIEDFNSSCLSIGLLEISNGNVVTNGNIGFGRYINVLGESFFVAPIEKINNIVLMNIIDNNNYINKEIFKNYYISCSKPCENVLYQCRGFIYKYYSNDWRNFGIIYDNMFNIKAKPVFNYLYEIYSTNDNYNIFDAIRNKVNGALLKINNSRLCLAGEPSTHRPDRGTVIQVNDYDISLDDRYRDLFSNLTILNELDIILLLNYSDNYYLNINDTYEELHICGEINTFKDNFPIGGDSVMYTKTSNIYDERGFKWNLEINNPRTTIDENRKAELLSKILYTIDNTGESSLYIKSVGNIGKDCSYVLPINSLNLFDISLESYHKSILFPFYKFDDRNIENKANTILFTNVYGDESKINTWNKIEVESYKLISENKGKIVKLFVLGESMFIHCEQSIYLLQFKDYLATTEESLQITQSSIKDISYKELLPTDKGYAGLQDKDAAIIGSFGYIFYENDINRILRLDNNQLIHIDYPILEWLQKYKPYKVRFANDVERNNLLIQFNYIVNNEEKLLILLYDYAINTFISTLNSNIFWFTEAYNTKNKLYLLQNNKFINNGLTYETSAIKCFNNYKFEKNIFKILNQNSEYIELTNKLGFVYNYNYNGIKFLENIMFKLFKYTKSEDPNTQNSIDFTNDPIENIRIPFCGDYVRIYNENIDTGWIDIKNAQNQNFNDRNNYDLPYYYLGDWIMNMFRNIRNKINDINYSKISGKDYTKADDRARLYGNYFIIEFGFNVNNFNDESDKFEIQSLVVNTTQQTNNM